MYKINIAKHKYARILDKGSEWGTYGVVTSMGPIKSSKTGNKFRRWTITDPNSASTVDLMLFGAAFKRHWKETQGSVIFVFDPQLMDARAGSENELRKEAAFSINFPEQIFIVGVSGETARCSHVSNGRSCNTLVTNATIKFCSFHTKQKFRDATSSRMDLNNGGSVHPRFIRESRPPAPARVKRKIVTPVAASKDVLQAAATECLNKSRKINTDESERLTSSLKVKPMLGKGTPDISVDLGDDDDDFVFEL